MKTTIEIPDVILERAKALAAREGSTVRALVEEGLQLVLRSRGRRAGAFRLRDASVNGNGLQTEFRAAGWDRVRNALYEAEER